MHNFGSADSINILILFEIIFNRFGFFMMVNSITVLLNIQNVKMQISSKCWSFLERKRQALLFDTKHDTTSIIMTFIMIIFNKKICIFRSE